MGGTMLICPPPLVAQCDAHRSGLYAPLPALYARLTNHPNHAHIYKPSFTNSGSWAKFQFQIQRDTNTSFNNGNVDQKLITSDNCKCRVFLDVLLLELWCIWCVENAFPSDMESIRGSQAFKVSITMITPLLVQSAECRPTSRNSK